MVRCTQTCDVATSGELWCGDKRQVLRCGHNKFIKCSTSQSDTATSSKYETVLQSITPSYKVRENMTKYTTPAYEVLQSITPYQIVRMPPKVTLQHHQILHLPRKVTLQHHQLLHLPRETRRGFQHNSHEAPFPMADDSAMIREWSENELVISRPPVRRANFSHFGGAFCVKNTTFRAAAIYPNFAKCCACHEKRHSNITKCCACLSQKVTLQHQKLTVQHHQMLREKQQFNITKWCACQEQSHSNITKCSPVTKSDTPTSPSVAPATKNQTRISTQFAWSVISNGGRRFDYDPRMIREWTGHLAPARSPSLLFTLWRRILCEKCNVLRCAYLPKFH